MLQSYLQTEEEEVTQRWERVETWMQTRFERSATIEAVLFLIGIQAKGRGFEPGMRKETKQDLIMEGTYHVFETIGLYQRVPVGTDEAWAWERHVSLPADLTIEAQEKLLRLAILRYFDHYVFNA